MSTGWLCHKLYMWHDTGASPGIPPPGLTVQPGTPCENAEPKRRFRNLVDVSGLFGHFVVIKPRYATEDEIAHVHARVYREGQDDECGGRGLSLVHTTIKRWIQRYVPEFEKRWSRFVRPAGRSWRVDETYIKIKGRRTYLYRAVDKEGNRRSPTARQTGRRRRQGLRPARFQGPGQTAA